MYVSDNVSRMIMTPQGNQPFDSGICEKIFKSFLFLPVNIQKVSSRLIPQ